MGRKIIWFDSYVRSRTGKLVPYADFTIVETDIEDKQLCWFHEGYGIMKLYRLWKVDDENYIAEDIQRCCSTSSMNWSKFLEEPESALV